ncbi:MAG: alpha/beta hydrolase, partial [Desulfitobacterium sp.]|nr:alpha/beta hydrolase [Desulfitobacterium sp.]
MSQGNQSILSPQGIRIFYRSNLPSSPKAVMIVSHGY